MSTTKNVKLINERLDSGLALLRNYYEVEEQPVDAVLANPVIGGRPHHARRFDIKGVGNLLVMTVTEAEENQLSSFVIMPYFRNLPLFSTDYVYSGTKRFFLLEIYDLSVSHDGIFEAGIERFREFGAGMTDMQDIPTRPAWYDDIRPVCHAKAPDESQDELAIQRFLAFLQLFIDMEQASPLLGPADLKTKWQKNREYADRLIDEGGGSVGLKFNPVYNAQWKETGEWQQSYHAYPAGGHAFEGWYDESGTKVCSEAEWFDEYGASRVLTARFV